MQFQAKATGADYTALVAALQDEVATFVGDAEVVCTLVSMSDVTRQGNAYAVTAVYTVTGATVPEAPPLPA